MRMTDADRLLLSRIANDDLTWRSNIAGRVTFRCWDSEQDAEIVTRRGKRLEAAGLIERWTGWQHGRGGVALTDKGRAVIDRAHSDATDTTSDRALRPESNTPPQVVR